MTFEASMFSIIGHEEGPHYDFMRMLEPFVKPDGNRRYALTTDLMKARFAAARLSGLCEEQAYEESFLPGVREYILRGYVVLHPPVLSKVVKRENLYQFFWRYTPQWRSSLYRNGIKVEVILREDGEVTRLAVAAGGEP